MWAITPRGIGLPVGFRAVRPEWELIGGETFKTSEDPIGKVLGNDGVSLRDPTRADNLSISRSLAKSDVNHERNEVLREGLTVSWNGSLWDADEPTQSRLGMTISRLADPPKGRPPPQKISWRDLSNAPHELNIEELKELHAAMLERTQEIFQLSWDLKDQIDQSETPEKIRWPR